MPGFQGYAIVSPLWSVNRWWKEAIIYLRASYSGGNLIIAGRNAHPVQGRKLQILEPLNRGTQRQFSENICSEDDLRSRIFGTFFVKFLACLPLLGFRASKNWCNCPFSTDFTLKSSPRTFGSLSLAEIFEKVSFDPYDFRISRLSARKSEQMKNF